jgi:hypothetical protein
MTYTYYDLLVEASKHINGEIADYRPASGMFIDGMNDNAQIPNAIICWLSDGSKIIYIHR